MPVEMFFNELSLNPIAIDEATAQVRAKQFILTMRAATASGVLRVLRVPEDFHRSDLSPNYDWYKYLGDDRVEREVRQFLRSLATRGPFLHDLPSAEVTWEQMDCLLQNHKTLGLKAAYVSDGLAFSLPSSTEWNSPSIKCEIQEIVNQNVDCRTESIHHASTVEHVDDQADWILQCIQTTVSDATSFRRYIHDFFPLIGFCDAVDDQVANLPVVSFGRILRGLFCLNAFCLEWQAGPFDPGMISCNVSPESKPTLEQFGAERSFLCPDGQKRIFSWHVKVGDWRIYFDPCDGPGRLLVGYVGPHLRTVRFN